MAYLFGDSFDFAASINDVSLRYSTTSGFTANLLSSANTAFGTGQGLAFNQNSAAQATSNFATNETTIFGSLRVKYPSISANSGIYVYVSLLDVSSYQVTIRWNADGSVTVYSGGPTFVAIQNFPSAFTLNTWDSWQFKIVINNTTGSVELRKNGASTNTYTLTGVNTRYSSSNSYANAAMLGHVSTSSTAFQVDDYFLCSSSGAAPNTWTGDLRALQQVPTGTVQAQFSLGGTAQQTYSPITSLNTGTYGTASANTIYFTLITASATGSVTSLFTTLTASATGNVIMAIYDNTGTGGGPGALLGSSNVITNPTATQNVFTMAAPPSVVKNSTYYVAILGNTATQISGGNSGQLNGVAVWSLANAYSSGFPSSAAGFSSLGSNVSGFAATGANIKVFNSNFVSELTEDGDTSYITASAAGTEDIYTLSSILATYTIVGINYISYLKKTDSGPRTVSLMVTANGSADTAVATMSPSGSYTYAQGFVSTDPTGATWTPTNVNSAKLGIKIAT